MSDRIKFLIAGALAGGVNGFFGAGGGMILVPMFCRLCKMDEQQALATSVAVILPLSLVSAGVYLLRGGVDIPTAIPFLIGGAVGGAVGGRWFKKLSPALLRRMLGVMIIWGGIRNLMP